MSRTIRQSRDFKADAQVARRLQRALDNSLAKLSLLPDLGWSRHFRNPKLQGLRSFLVERPFEKILILIAQTMKRWMRSGSCTVLETCPAACSNRRKELVP